VYESYFSLARPAFAKAPDPAFFFESGGHEQAAAHLLYAAESGEVGVLTGEVGCGKTTVCRVVWKEIASRPQFIPLSFAHPRLTPGGILDAVAAKLREAGMGDAPPAGRSKESKLNEIAVRMKAVAAAGKTLVVLCDEAQALKGPQALEEFRLLTNFQTDDRSLVSILLVGQDELLGKLRHPSLRSLRQRIGLRFRLSPLAERETDEYLRHRLAAAGAPDPTLFEPGTGAWLHRLSQGIPRLLNTLATQALVQAMAEGKHRVDVSVVSAVEKDLAWPAGENQKHRTQRDEPWWT